MACGGQPRKNPGAPNMARLITEVLGPNLKDGNWCIITTPKRRHLIKNFATRISEAIAARLDIPFYEDVCSCKNRQRMNAVFTVNLVPKEQNVICFDDFVTTGNTLKSMKVALEKYKLNILFFSGINNKL
jgi:predicted amidophosphoribosyltransferase